MTQITDILNVDTLGDLIKEGFISRKFHQIYKDLAILNYTPAAQYDSHLQWGPEMNNCRGFIYNANNGVVIARPYKKFWNLNDERHPETLEQNLPSGLPLVTDKLDGSMGIVFPYDGKFHVATRGSFHSEQANWATSWLRSNYPHLDLPDDSTVITEILYKENRIVIHYDWEGLIVTGIIRINTGEEWSRPDAEVWAQNNRLQIVPKFEKTLVECAKENATNQEGYVLTYPNGLKVKVKFDEYVRLHRILTGLNPKAIWELLSEGQTQTINQWLHDPAMPSGFITWLNGWHNQLVSDYADIELAAARIFANRPNTPDRKTLAFYFTAGPNKTFSGLCFSMLDGMPATDPAYKMKIWKMIKPKAADTFRIEGE